jgi:hypothetical protein
MTDHVHTPVAATGLREEQRGDRTVPVYTFRCACGREWDEDYLGGDCYRPSPPA